MKYCPHCRTEHPDESVFCPTCGKKLVLADVCPKCGKSIDRDALYCPHCGHNLSRERKKSFTSDDITRYRGELANLKTKRKALFIGGLVTFIVGIVFFLLCLGLMINFSIKIGEGAFSSTTDENISIATLVISCIGITFNTLVFGAGIIMLIIQKAVFAKRIENREKAIAEFEA